MTKLRTKQTKYPVLAGNSKQKTGDGSLPCDKNCNITSGTYGSYTTRYTYDTANQLLREDNQAAGKTWVYTYDNAGNILTKTTYAYTTATNPGTAQDTVTYTYGNSTWGDLLTNYNGKAITYDTIGNPLTYGSRTYTWEHGRQLASLTENGTTWSYTYGADGLRTGKTNGTTTYTYLYKDGKLTYMANQSRKLYFSYDGSGKPYAMWYSGTNYYYVTNLQGDVIGILDNQGNQIVTYTYDAWGNILDISGSHASTIGQYNPLRYRGYIYDSETNLYYLQSRYYDPNLGRFLSADAFASTGQGILGNNMFAYCLNNPVAFSDDTGAVAKVCLSADREIDDAPWKDGFGGSFYYINPRTSMCKNVPSDCRKNTSIDVVLNTDGVSWYHGATVVKFSSDVISSFAIGKYIFLNRSQNTATTLKHEYGHVTQARDYGLVKYTAIIFLPSVTYNVASRFNEELGDYYYSMPWEYDADMRGGNHRNYADGAERLRDEYFGRFG